MRLPSVPPAAPLPEIPAPQPVEEPRTRIPRLVISDLDGTLLHRASMSARTRDAVLALSNAGIQFAIATGRTVGLLAPVIAMGIEAIAICDNGAITYDMTSGSVLAAQLIEPALVAELADKIHHRDPDACLGVSRISPDPTVMYTDERLMRMYDYGQQVLPLDEFGSVPAAKLFVVSRELDSLQLAKRFADITGDRVNVAWTSLEAGMIEITAAGVTKETAAMALARRWRIDAFDVAALGDSNNDLELLAWAGIAVVPANGSAAAKALANIETLSVEDDGMAVYLENLVARTV